MNDTDCKQLHSNTTVSGWCPPTWDNWLCWPPTRPGENVTMACPFVRGRSDTGRALKICSESGTWQNANETSPSGFTHYNDCIIMPLRHVWDMCERIDDCKKIMQNARIIEMVGLSFSLITMLISLYIFFQYRVLKNNRTKIHKNLFIATLLQVITRLIRYVDQEFNEKESFILQTQYLDETTSIFLEYTKTAMFMWMFIEGLYLHNMITVTVFQEYSYITLYFYIGWTVPAIITGVWVLAMLLLKSNWAFYYLLPCYWILDGPRYTVIVINLLFLINIIRVLIVKLRESRTSELEQVRKAVRAAIFLLPLMGITNIFFVIDYQLFVSSWHLSAWSYTSYFLNTFQGFFVAVLYCFLNGEVQTALKNSFYVHMSLRNNDYYAACRNLTVVSSAPEIEAAHHINQNAAVPKWIHCFKHFNAKSSHNSSKDLPQSNGHRNSTVVTAITMVEGSNRISNQPDAGLCSDDNRIAEDACSESKV